MRKPLATACILAVSVMTAAAQTADGLTAEQKKAIAARTCALPKIADVVSLTQVPGSDLMTAPVIINGTTEQFLVDIGTRATSVSQAARAGLSLPEDFRRGEDITGAPGLTGGGLVDVPVYDATSGLGSGAQEKRVRAGSFTIGNATTRYMKFGVSTDRDMGVSEPYNGLLTGAFFRQYDVELNFPGKEITYLSPTDCTDPDQVVFWAHSIVGIIPVTWAKDGRLQAQVMVQGHVINAEFDTGSARTIMRHDIAEHIVGLKPGSAGTTPVDGLKDNAGLPVYVHTFPQLVFTGAFTAVNVPILIQDFSTARAERTPLLESRAQFAETRLPDLTIGMDVLRHLHMYVVSGQGRVYVTN